MNNEDNACSIKKELDVPVAMDILCKTLFNLSDKVGVLSDRIQPIIRNEPPREAPSQKRAEYSTPLVSDIAGNVSRVEEITDCVNSLIERCQL